MIEDWNLLIQSSLAGDEGAREELVHTMALIVRAYYRRRGMSDRDAEELAVSTISDVIMSLSSYRPEIGQSFKQWLYGTCRRKRADEFRRRYRSGEAIRDPSLLVEQTGGGSVAESSGPREALADALTQLSPQDRYLVAARHAREVVEFRMLASELNLDAALCRKRFERAMKKLRKLLELDPRMASWRGNFHRNSALKQTADPNAAAS